jgi:hypothetical protein
MTSPASATPGTFQFSYLQGTNQIYRRGPMLAAGGFDDNIFFFGGDCEICGRLIDAGWVIRSLPSSAVHHKYLPSGIRDHQRITTNWYPVVHDHTHLRAAPRLALPHPGRDPRQRRRLHAHPRPRHPGARGERAAAARFDGGRRGDMPAGVRRGPAARARGHRAGAAAPDPRPARVPAVPDPRQRPSPAHRVRLEQLHRGTSPAASPGSSVTWHRRWRRAVTTSVSSPAPPMARPPSTSRTACGSTASKHPCSPGRGCRPGAASGGQRLRHGGAGRSRAHPRVGRARPRLHAAVGRRGDRHPSPHRPPRRDPVAAPIAVAGRRAGFLREDGSDTPDIERLLDVGPR